MTGSLSLVSLTDSGSSFPFATAPFFASPTEQQHIRERANRASAFLALRGSDAPRKDSMGT
jgi:hypothetical protein